MFDGTWPNIEYQIFHGIFFKTFWMYVPNLRTTEFKNLIFTHLVYTK